MPKVKAIETAASLRADAEEAEAVQRLADARKVDNDLLEFLDAEVDSDIAWDGHRAALLELYKEAFLDLARLRMRRLERKRDFTADSVNLDG